MLELMCISQCFRYTWYVAYYVLAPEDFHATFAEASCCNLFPPVT